jgi:hypothetical protein
MTLFILLRELRDEIYAIALSSDHSIDQPFVRTCPNTANKLVIPAFMLTCKQIHEEALPLFTRSLKFVIHDDVAPDSMQQWLPNSFPMHNIRDIRTVAFTFLQFFRTVNPCERRFILNTQKGMPWLPRPQTSQTTIFTGNVSCRDPVSDELSPSQFLLALLCLQHVEMPLPVKRVSADENPARWSWRHDYDLESLKGLGKLKSLTINLILDVQRRRLYKDCLKRMENGSLRRMDHILKSALEDAYGLRSWLEEDFQQKGLIVDVRCICHNLDPYREGAHASVVADVEAGAPQRIPLRAYVSTRGPRPEVSRR